MSRLVRDDRKATVTPTTTVCRIPSLNAQHVEPWRPHLVLLLSSNNGWNHFPLFFLSIWIRILIWSWIVKYYVSFYFFYLFFLLLILIVITIQNKHKINFEVYICRLILFALLFHEGHYSPDWWYYLLFYYKYPVYPSLVLALYLSL